jgi:hypothetical protein
MDKRVVCVAQVVEQLLSMQETLDSIPSKDIKLLIERTWFLTLAESIWMMLK